MKTLPPLLCALGLLVPAGLFAGIPFKQPTRSVSASGEFIIYCDDMHMRVAVSGFCEEAKGDIMDFLGARELSARERWKIPIVINLLQPDPSLVNVPAVQILPRTFEDGSRNIELDIILRGNLADLYFQQQVVKAILLEMEYRDKPVWKEHETIIDPPQWLVEGLCAYMRNRKSELDTDVYQALLANGDVPALKDFLSQTVDGMSETSLRLYQAYSYSFIQLLSGLPGGQNSLASYIIDLPVGKDAPAADLLKHFPTLGDSPESLEKWWTLSMARLAATDRYKGLTLDETEQKLSALLKFKIPTDKTGKTTKEYGIDDFRQFVKNPQAQPVLVAANNSLQYLATQANPLFRPVIADYMMIIGEVQTNKTHQVPAQLKEVAAYRQMVLKRMDQIADYLNWYEATQFGARSDSFNGYLKSVKDLTNESPKRNDAISTYLDSLEIQMQ